jgi:hypothetical protein
VLSSIYAKKSGFSINLHTDSKGYEYLKMCPYDNIYVDLDDIDLPAKKLYAAVKFKVMEKYPVGVIHIDGDVLLKNSNLIELLKFNEYDCIVQSVEAPPIYGWGWDQTASVWDNCEYPEWANRKCKIMYNCGVVGFNNKELKDEYFNTYWNMYKQYLEKGIDKDSIYFLLDRIFPMKKINYYGDMRKYNKHLLSCIEMQSDLVLISKNHIFKGTAKGSKLGTITRDDIKVDGILFECIFDKVGKNYIKFLLKESIKNPKSKRLIVDSVKMNMSMERLDILKKEVSE